GHRCEVCGNVTYRHIVKGSRVRFAFRDEIEQQSMFSPQLAMTVYRYDPERGYIYFEEGFHEGGFCTVVNQRASEYMKHHRGKWQKVTAWGKNLIRVRYHPRFDNDLRDMVFVYDVYKHAWGAKIVRLWNGREYSEWDRLPVPESISIHETWHWKHLPKSPTLHVRILHACGQTDDKGWHYQDGRPWFRPGHWENMARFIRHFTQLDADAFDRAWPRFPSDGPGGIDALARWCHESPVVTNEPNVGNLLVALGKAFEGRRLTDGEVKAAMLGLEDPSARELFM
ncbi:hypothetical protein KJ605_00805, partial [Patescibacteria group bacterium]|nr:hypothetical protein [Patescibacteria group bacterium]